MGMKREKRIDWETLCEYCCLRDEKSDWISYCTHEGIADAVIAVRAICPIWRVLNGAGDTFEDAVMYAGKVFVDNSKIASVDLIEALVVRRNEIYGYDPDTGRPPDPDTD